MLTFKQLEQLTENIAQVSGHNKNHITVHVPNFIVDRLVKEHETKEIEYISKNGIVTILPNK